MTALIYKKHPNVFELCAHITQGGSDAKGTYIILDQTLFYPQGGGQPADQGKITARGICYDVWDVRDVDHQIRHYITLDGTALPPHGPVLLNVNQERRTLHSKYHTAGHLVAAVAEKINPALKAIKGHQFPGEAYVECDGAVCDTEHFVECLNAQVSAHISSDAACHTKDISLGDIDALAQNLPYAIPKDKPLRVCHIDGFDPVPCGGTHTSTLKDIGSLVVQKCKSKKGKTKIYYTLN